MTALDAAPNYDAEYDNRGRHPEHVEIAERWAAASVAYREAAALEADIPYGPSPRNRFDLFAPTTGLNGAPLVAFIHGGYWKSRDRKDFSFIAKAFNDAGLAVAMPSYDLCPKVTILEIVEQIRAFLRVLWGRCGRRLVVVGHSAGGHLTACMVATDWAAYDDVPADLVTAGYAISGIFDLAPLYHTFMRDELRLTPEAAAAASPLAWQFPRQGRHLVAAVGSDETDEFLRQSHLIAESWGREGVRTRYAGIEGSNHFTVLDALTAPDGPMLPAVEELAGTLPGT